MNKYTTKLGHIFTAKDGYRFDIDLQNREYMIRGPYATIVFNGRKSFDMALEMDTLETYVTEIYNDLWN